MDMVKLAFLTAVAAASALASDFTIEIGSPVAVTADTQKATKIKGGVFSIRAKDCPDAQFTGVAHWESGRKQALESLVFTAGSVPGTYSVTRTTTGAWANWIAVITAECRENKLGVMVPVSSTGVYDRAAAKFVPRSPNPSDMEEMLRTVQGATR